MDDNSTEHFNIIKPNPETPVSDDVHTIRTAFDLIDALLKVISEAVAKKAEQGHIHDFAGVKGLEDELKEFRRRDEDINIGDLGDVLNPDDAQLNYVLAKTALGYAFRSALSVLGEHQHPIANIVGLQDVLNSFVSGSAGSLDGEIPVYQGTSGKAVKRGGVTLASILQDIAGKAATSHAHSADDIVSGIFADARIPSLNASKTTAGVFNINRIPNIPYSKVTDKPQELTNTRFTGLVSVAIDTWEGSAIGTAISNSGYVLVSARKSSKWNLTFESRQPQIYINGTWRALGTW